MIANLNFWKMYRKYPTISLSQLRFLKLYFLKVSCIRQRFSRKLGTETVLMTFLLICSIFLTIKHKNQFALELK